jgi:hypothetical protein
MEVHWFLLDDVPQDVKQKDALLDNKSGDDVYYRLDSQTLSFK